MLGLFRFGYVFYRILITSLAPFNEKAKKWAKGRRNIYTDLKNLSPSDSCLWFHAASLGEFEMGRPVIEKLKEKHPQHKILVTFFSPSGYDERKNDPLLDFACYLPHDQPNTVNRFLNKVNPVMAVIIKYEFWPCILSECIKRRIPTSLISATFRSDQFVFSSLGTPLRKLLHQFHLISVQDPSSFNLLKGKGFTNVELTGDGRFDNVSNLAEKQIPNEFIESFLDHRPSILAGSCWKEDEDVLLPLILKQNSFVFIFAPHDISENNVQRLESRLPIPSFRWSRKEEVENPENYRVLIIDTIGELRGLYSQTDMAFVGGGFKTGLHNILEPASFGKPVFFGPKHSKFWEAQALMDAGGARMISTSNELNNLLEKFSSNRQPLLEMGEQSKQFVAQNTGASSRIAELLGRQLH